MPGTVQEAIYSLLNYVDDHKPVSIRELRAGSKSIQILQKRLSKRKSR